MTSNNAEVQTVAELPITYNSYGENDYRNICIDMKRTGFHKWGWVIYRCTYGDDDLWRRYVAQLKANCREYLAKGRRSKLLEDHMDFVFIEDEKLENASPSDVRRLFDQWVAQQGVVEPPPRVVPMPHISKLPRFRYCLYVDKKCLDTVIQFQEGDHGMSIGRYIIPPMVFVVIDRSWTPDRTHGYPTMNDSGYPLIDGCSRKYVGWEYVNALGVVDTYEALSGLELDEGTDYQRPPAIYPRGRELMPM